jgi:beta-galactosidase
VGSQVARQQVRTAMKRILIPLILCAFSVRALPQPAPYAPPPSLRSTLNFDLNWRFVREDVPGAEAPSFDDSAWATVSTPHTFNDVDSFRQIISHSGGDRGTYKGLAWYRKHFRLPARLAGHRIFLEFEGMRQSGDIFLNGKQGSGRRTRRRACLSCRTPSPPYNR